MKLARGNLYINQQKVNDYLLNINHVDGGSKARLLIGCGFNVIAPSVLEHAIINHAVANEVTKKMVTAFGEKYLIEGLIDTPIGRQLSVRSVWVRELKEELFKFVTLYPI